jgi:DNA polymerase-3 subunit epsilon
MSNNIQVTEFNTVEKNFQFDSEKTLTLDSSWRFKSEELKALLEQFPNGVVVLDLETTGLSPFQDKIIEIGAVKLKTNEISFFKSFVNPQKKIPQDTIAIHGIEDEMVSQAPIFEEINPSWQKFAEDLPLIAHNAKFDLGFLVFENYQIKTFVGNHEIYCSCLLSRQVLKDVPNHRLATLATYYSLPLENHHRALDDSLACFQIFSKLLCEENLKDIHLEKAFLFNTEAFTGENSLELKPEMELLPNFIKRKEIINIIYKGGSHKGKKRPVEPVSILPMPLGNVLYAKCLLTNIYKSFVLTKIDSIYEMTDEEKLPYLEKDPMDRSYEKKKSHRFQQLIILIAHLILLYWMYYSLTESGYLTFTSVMLHFTGMSIYGAFLIRGTAAWAKWHHEKNLVN